MGWHPEVHVGDRNPSLPVGMPATDPAKDIRHDEIVSGTTAAAGGGAAATLAEITEKIEPLALYSEIVLYLALTLGGVGLFA